MINRGQCFILAMFSILSFRATAYVCENYVCNRPAKVHSVTIGTIVFLSVWPFAGNESIVSNVKITE